MPVQPTYPGVYVEEIPSGVRTITGVSTSITAFIGAAKKGIEDEPVTVFSFGDYERTFGGLWEESRMSFAVRDFFQNGGGEALIVRVTDSGTAASLTITDELTIAASSAGEWGEGISFWIDHNTKEDPDNELFNLFLEHEDGDTETFLNLSIDEDSANYAINVVEQNSMLVRITSLLARPAEIVETAKETLENGSNGLPITSTQILGVEDDKTGLYALEKADLFNILCIPPYAKDSDIEATTYSDAITYCRKRRAVCLVDSPEDWNSRSDAVTAVTNNTFPNSTDDHAAILFPRLMKPNPLKNNQIEEYVPCGTVAGIIARTDVERGVWKAPAGTDATIRGITGLSVSLTDDDNGKLNQIGVNCLRSFPVYGNVVWGSRTLAGADVLASEWKYLPVRRTALYIEESLFRGLKWVVFEPNDEPLWAQIRLNVGAFMHNMFRQGAFQGDKKEAYFVKCDSETTTQNDINLGIVNIVVGFAPLKPAEFVILKIQQIAGQLET